MLRPLGLAAVLLMGVLSGCASPASDAADLPASSSSTTAMVPPPPKVPAVFVGSCQTSSGLSFGVAQVTESSLQAAQCAFAQAKPGDVSNLTASLVEVAWVPAPGVTGISFLLESDHCRSRGSIDTGGYHQENCNHGLATSSTSPFRFEVPQDVLREAGNDNLTVTVAPTGASTSQAFSVYVTLFEAAMPEGYSAIAA